jgi:DNA-directed RNA polymerase subunit alpha
MLVMVNFNKFLQPGQGITIGNQLRRVLLGDLGGIAISAVRIAGVTHEFSTIPGVREDILEILLNLKGIVVKNKTQDIEFGRLKVQGPSVITDLIQLPSNLEIVNPNHYIATILPQTFLKLNLSLNMVLVIG